MGRNRWDDEQVEPLKGLIARKLGSPFPGIRETRVRQKARTEKAKAEEAGRKVSLR
ncbi:hypothetical protein V1281_007356 [Nitrobacteraceae bacterium AZCC 2161]